MNQEPIFCHLFGIFVQNLKIFSLSTASLLSNPIEYLKGVGPLRADMLKKELSLFTFNDLLHHFPHRHIDKTKVGTIASITPDMDFIQIKGILQGIDIIGVKRSKRMVTQLKDETGTIELAWFQGISWVQKKYSRGPGLFSFWKGKFF